MAYLAIEDTLHTSVTIAVNDLQYERSRYDKFVFNIFQNGTKILSYTHRFSGSYKDASLSFKNDNYLGYNWFSPGTRYTAEVDCYWKGTGYTVGPVSFVTDSISPPSGSSISPRAWPTIRDQGTVGNCCAMAVETAMEYLHASNSSMTPMENYSISYIFGQSSSSDPDGMYNEEAVEIGLYEGSPRYELFATVFPDNRTKSSSRTYFANRCSLARQNAQHQRFTRVENIDFYDTDGIASVLRSGGCVFFSFRDPWNLLDTPSSGIVAQPSGGIRGGHAMLIIGMTTKNGKKHWICQNSWGEWYGQKGIFYVPYDWGCGVQSGCGSSNTGPTSWTQDCYALYNDNLYDGHSHPTPPSIYSAKMTSANDALIKWSGTDYSGSSVLIFARAVGTEPWYPKSDYGVTYTGGSATIHFDSATKEYEVMIIACKNNLLSVHSPAILIEPGRPGYWTWKLGVVSAKPAYNMLRSGDPIPAMLGRRSDWNSFCALIQEMRVYKGLSTYSFKAYPYVLTAGMVKDAMTAINEIYTRNGLSGNPLPALSTIVSNKTKVSASLLNALADSINRIA